MTRSMFDAPPSRHYSRWRLWKWLGSQAYGIGLARGVGYHQSGRDGRWTTIRWGGKPIYVLWWPVDKWKCLLGLNGRPHWPFWERGSDHGYMGGCGKCRAWQCCGAITWEHKPDCPEVTM